MMLKSQLPKDRIRTGVLWLEDDADSTIWGPVPCFGKADNQGAIDHGNPTRDPLKPYGDHPTGQYTVRGLAPSSPQEQWAYGPYGKLVLAPVHGACRDAELNGRYGLLIHGGGRGGPYHHGYRPTYGCLRIADNDMEALVDLWRVHRFDTYCCVEE